MAVEPFLLAGLGADVGDPAVGQFLGGVVQAAVGAVGECVMVDGRFDKIAGGVTFMVGPEARRPALFAIVQRVGGLHVAVRLLGGEDFRDPIFERALQFLLGRGDFLVALRVDHQCDADRLNRLMDPGVGEHVAAVPIVRPAGQLVRPR